jgi:hypothetical protein
LGAATAIFHLAPLDADGMVAEGWTLALFSHANLKT